ncbi:MAG: pimeloyl-ACP methyl ester carboxylesterase [Candidatus Azotimanducaceae bacterium]|jgi:pimeloyl-ACP methyl ester carboxylesterase
MMNKQFAALTNDIKIAYLERAGGSTPLVLLHGITESSRSFEHLLPSISAHCHVYALDLRGHGDSSKPDELYQTEAYAADVIGFITEVIKEPVLLAGHSLGGLVTVQVAASAPQLTQRILLEDPPLYFVNGLNDVYRAAFEAMALIATTLQNGSTARDTWFDVLANAPDPYTGKPGIESVGETKINQRLDSLSQLAPKALQDGLDVSLNKSGLDDSLKWNADDFLKHISCPVTLLTGNADLGSVMTTEDSQKAMARLNDGQHIHFSDVGHMIHDNKPEEWMEAIRRFSEID